MKKIISDYNLNNICSILVSRVSDSDFSAKELVSHILQDELVVRFQLQLHKVIWGNEKKR